MADNTETCLVCATAGSMSRRYMVALSTGRGLRRWDRCKNCGSYCDATPYNIVAEVKHTRTCSWGRLQSGLRLNEYKTRMFLSVLKLLGRYAPARGTLLDVGCSYGGFLQCAREHGYEVSGMDIVPETVKYMREHGFVCHAVKSVGELSIPDGSLDVVSVLDCNYYWPSQIPELQAIRRKLRPRGLLVMRVVDKSWMFAAGLVLRKCLPSIGGWVCRRAVNDHRVSIPVRSLLRILSSEGLSVLYASPRGAMHSDRSSIAVKLGFAIRNLVWLVSQRYLAPGCLILMQKNDS